MNPWRSAPARRRPARPRVSPISCNSNACVQCHEFSFPYSANRYGIFGCADDVGDTFDDIVEENSNRSTELHPSTSSRPGSEDFHPGARPTAVHNSRVEGGVDEVPDSCVEFEEVGEEEAKNVKLYPELGQPTEKERKLHEATHLPYRSWCAVCVCGCQGAGPSASQVRPRQ